MTAWPLAQIAKVCGYSSSNLLIRHFKKNTGFPPILYRAKAQQGEVFSPSRLSTLSEDLKNYRHKRVQNSPGFSESAGG